MTRLREFRLETEKGEESGYAFWCPACKQPHRFTIVSPITGRPKWTFDGNLESPSFSPSLLYYTPQGKVGDDGKWKETGRKTNCHLHVKRGQIQYCGDFPHEYKGNTVALQEWPEGCDVWDWKSE